jgi:hypothetical protein
MDRAHKTGLIIVAGAALELLLFLYGAVRKSYLALALPVAAAMAMVTALGFWVGWTMMNMEEEPAEPPIATEE